jgi:hypothetical protein
MPDLNWKGAGQGAGMGMAAGSIGGPWGMAIGGVAGGLLGMFGGGDEERPTSDIWGPQKGYLTDIYSQAQDLYGQTKSPSEFENQMYDYGQGFYGPNGQANQMANNIYGLGQGYSQMGNEALQRYMQGGAPQIQYNYENVNQGINNDILQAQIDAATAGTYRDLRENQLTGTALAGAGMGNLGGSRGHQMEAILTRGALDAATNTAGTMRGKAYETAYSGELDRAIKQAQLDAERQQGYGQFGQGMASMGLQAQQNAYGMYGNNITSGLNLGTQRRMAPWQALQAYQQAIGAPIQINLEQQSSPIIQGMGYMGQGLSAGMGSMQQQQMNQQYLANQNNAYNTPYNNPYAGGAYGGAYRQSAYGG